MMAEPLSRRAFLGRCIAFLGTLIAAILGSIGGRYVLFPLFKHRREDWVDLGPIADIRPGRPMKVEFVQRRHDAWMTTERRASAWVLTPNGKDFVVFDPRCTHLGCPYRWDNERKQFLCPCHAGIFNINGGVVSGPPPRPLDQYPHTVRDGQLLILPNPTQAAA